MAAEPLPLGLSEYKYERLNWASNDIRLIQISSEDAKTADDTRTAVECTIESVSLDDKPSYIALSYAWEDTTLSKPLILNGRLAHITASLDKALRQIRQIPSIRSRRFWIDAVCIHQDDELEKSWQVQQMTRIFKDAELALVWLGHISSDTREAVEALEELDQMISEDPNVNDINLADFLSHLQDDLVSALNDLLMRPWWRRIWVVQEFASAKDIVFLCGSVRLSWQACSIAFEALQNYQRSIAEQGWRGSTGAQYRQDMAKFASIAGVLRLFHIRRTLSVAEVDKSPGKFSLWQLLTLKRFGMQASDNRDLVYALTGIAHDASAKHIYPDYTKHVREIYIAVATCFLAEGRFRTLWLCSHPRRIPNLPSWVPDWSSTWRTDHRYLSSDSGYGSGGRIFSASGLSKPVVSFSTRGLRPVLHIQGIVFDTIEATKPTFNIDKELPDGGLDQAHRALQQRLEAFQELSAHSAAVFRSTITDISLKWQSDTWYVYRRHEHSWRRQIFDTSEGESNNGKSESRGEEQKPSLHLQGDPSEGELYQSLSWSLRGTAGFDNSTSLPAPRLDILYRHNGRRPFVTKKGHLGLGPAELRPGDIVAVILGSEVPLILRRVGGAGGEDFVLVGEAYVNDIMDGEVMGMGLRVVGLDVL